MPITTFTLIITITIIIPIMTITPITAKNYNFENKGCNLPTLVNLLRQATLVRVQQVRKKEDLEEINLVVKQCYEAIQGELKHMISSLLKRSSRRVIIDRVIKKDDSDITLLNQRNEVLEEVRDHFQKQFRKRNT